MKNAIWLKDWNLLVDNLPEDKQLLLFNLFRNYQIDLDCDDIAVKPIWFFIRSQLNNMNEKYEQNIVNRNKINGLRGGRPRTQINTENPVGYLETQKTLNNNSNNNSNNNIYENSTIFFNFRNSIFKDLPNEFKERLKAYGITKPQIRSTNNMHEQYIDVVDILYKIDQDKEWQHQQKITLNIDDAKFVKLMKEFIKKYVGSNEIYNIVGFKNHFFNWSKKQITNN